MARRKKNRRGKPAAAAVAAPEESRAAEAITVLWVLSFLSAAGAGTLTLLLSWAAATAGEAETAATWRVFRGLMLLTALVTGTLCAVLTPLLYRLRRRPPPRSLGIAAYTVGLAAWLLGLLVAWRG